MTTRVDVIVTLLHNLLAFGALWALVFCFWRSYRVERIRDRIFQLRYELFVMAEQGEISFDHPGYWMLRVQLNRMLARAHRITGFRLLLSSPKVIDDPRDQWTQCLKALPDGTSKKLQLIEARMAYAIFWQVMTGSPISFLIAVCLVVKGMLGNSTKSHRDAFVDAISRDAFELPLEKQESALLAVG